MRDIPSEEVLRVTTFLLSTAISKGADFEGLIYTQQGSFQERFWDLWMTAWERGLFSETLELRIADDDLEHLVFYMAKALGTMADLTTPDLFDFMGLGQNVFSSAIAPPAISFSEYLARVQSVIAEV